MTLNEYNFYASICEIEENAVEHKMRYNAEITKAAGTGNMRFSEYCEVTLEAPNSALAALRAKKVFPDWNAYIAMEDYKDGMWRVRCETKIPFLRHECIAPGCRHGQEDRSPVPLP